jgi:cellulose synthase operon protein C
MKTDEEQIQAWLDGTLSDEETEALEQRLAVEPALAERLHAQLQLKALELEVAALPPSPPLELAPKPMADTAQVVPFRRQSPRLVLAGSVVVAAAAALLVSRLSTTGVADADAAWNLAPTRSHAFRLAFPAASAHREYAVVRSDNVTAEPLRLKLLAELEEKAQWHGLGVAQLLRGETATARKTLAKAGHSPEVQSDASAAALADGDTREALRLSSDCLGRSPLPSCQWNKALALEALGLSTGARALFEAVASGGEAGWSPEARRRAEALKAGDMRAAYVEGRRQAADWVLAGISPPASFSSKTPGLARLAAHVVLAMQSDAASVEMASAMLRAAQARPNEAFLSAGQVKGAPLAEGFRRLYLSMLPGEVRQFVDARGVQVFAAEEKAEFLRAVQATGSAYQKATAMLLGYDIARDPAQFAQAMRGQSDGWYDCGRRLQESVQAFAQNRLTEAEQQLQAATAVCEPYAYRMTQLEGLLGRVLLTAGRVNESGVLARRALVRAAALNQQDFALYNIETVAEGARYEENLELAEAFFSELSLAQPGSCSMKVRRHESIASMLSRRGARQRAREEMKQATCETPSLVGMSVLADLVRNAPEAGDVESFQHAAQGYRKQFAQAGSDLLQVDYYEALTRLPTRRSEAMEKLEALGSLAQGGDELSKKASGFALSTLAIEHGRAGDWSKVIESMSKLNGVPAPTRCAVAVERDLEYRVVAVVGLNGTSSGAFLQDGEQKPATALSPAGFDALKGCARVAMLSGVDTYGMAALLPAQYAWFYASPQASRAVATGGSALVVRNVSPVAALNLPQLESQSGSVDGVLAEGAAATVDNVLRLLPESNWVEFHTHGIVDAHVAEAAYLVLSPDVKQRYALTAEDIAKLRLHRRPVVLLASCRSALATARHRANAWSLPVAFARAGARAVIAATGDLPDRAAAQIFQSLRRRMGTGLTAAEALRDERLARAQNLQFQFVNQLVVFEEVNP